MYGNNNQSLYREKEVTQSGLEKDINEKNAQITILDTTINELNDQITKLNDNLIILETNLKTQWQQSQYQRYRDAMNRLHLVNFELTQIIPYILEIINNTSNKNKYLTRSDVEYAFSNKISDTFTDIQNNLKKDIDNTNTDIIKKYNVDPNYESLKTLAYSNLSNLTDIILKLKTNITNFNDKLLSHDNKEFWDNTNNYDMAISNNDNTKVEVYYDKIINMILEIERLVYDINTEVITIQYLETQTELLYNKLQVDILKSQNIETNIERKELKENQYILEKDINSKKTQIADLKTESKILNDQINDTVDMFNRSITILNDNIKSLETKLITQWQEEEKDKFNDINSRFTVLRDRWFDIARYITPLIDNTIIRNEYITNTQFKNAFSNKITDNFTDIQNNFKTNIDNTNTDIIKKYNVDPNYESLKTVAYSNLSNITDIILKLKTNITNFNDKVINNKIIDTIRNYYGAINNNNHTNAKEYYNILLNLLSEIERLVYDINTEIITIQYLETQTESLYNKLQTDIAKSQNIQTNTYLYNSLNLENNKIDEAMWQTGEGATLKNKKTLNQMGENTRLNSVNTALFVWYWILLLGLFCIDFFLFRNVIMSNEWIIRYSILILFPFAIGLLEYLLFLIWRKFNNIAFVNPTV
jgi:hypothetical protein